MSLKSGYEEMYVYIMISALEVVHDGLAILNFCL